MAWGVPKIGTIATVASGDLTLTEPAGIAAGDLMIACIAIRSTVGFTNGDWTKIQGQLSGDTDATNGIASGEMWYVVRGSSAPTLVFSRTAGNVGHGRIIAYEGGAASPLDVSSSNTLASASATATTGTITTAEAGELIVAMTACGDNLSTSAFDAATDPTTASGATDTTTAPTNGTWLERSDDGTNTGADTGLAIADAIRATAGATGTIQATVSASARHVMIAAAFKLENSRRARVTWAEMEVPNAPRRARVTWAELEVPSAPRRAHVTWAEMEVPTAPRRARVTWAELEVPNAPRRARVTWAELEVPNAPRRAHVTWAEMEVPDAPAPDRRAHVTWAELEIPTAPRRAAVTWAEMEVPTAPRRAAVTWAELEVPNAPRRAWITWAELEVPDVGAEPPRRGKGFRRILYDAAGAQEEIDERPDWSPDTRHQLEAKPLPEVPALPEPRNRDVPKVTIPRRQKPKAEPAPVDSPEDDEDETHFLLNIVLDLD
jgi:hypothetical protein